jgi:Tfp pilus assembly protein PilO
MDARTITNVLLTIIILILGYKWFYPAWKAKQARKAEAKKERMRKEVEPLYQQYVQIRKSLREQYDPEHKWSEFEMNAPDMPTEYRDAIASLTEAYKGVLVIKFGDHILMPKS